MFPSGYVNLYWPGQNTSFETSSALSVLEKTELARSDLRPKNREQRLFLPQALEKQLLPMLPEWN